MSGASSQESNKHLSSSDIQFLCHSSFFRLTGTIFTSYSENSNSDDYWVRKDIPMGLLSSCILHFSKAPAHSQHSNPT